METIKVTITGTASLLHHRDTLSNPLSDITKTHKLLTSKKRKTDEDHEAIAHSEWVASIYHADDIGPYVPAIMIEGAMLGGAKLQRLGVKFKSSVSVLENRIPLQYDGPRTLDGMWAISDFVDMRSVKVQTARIQRCRPKFDNWKASFTVAYNPAVVDRQELVKALGDAGEMVGIGDFRPRFGKFSVEVK